MGKKINGVILAVTGVALTVGTAGAVPATAAGSQAKAGKNVRTADATVQPKVKQGPAATSVRVNATPGGAVSGSTATDVKIKGGATPSTPTKSELGSQVNPTVKQGSTPGGKVGAAQAGNAAKGTNPTVKPGASPGGEVAEYLIKR